MRAKTTRRVCKLYRGFKQVRIMQLKLYPLLKGNSARAILREKKRWGHPHRYNPRQALLESLSKKTGMSTDEVREQLLKEREFLLKHINYYL